MIRWFLFTKNWAYINTKQSLFTHWRIDKRCLYILMFFLFWIKKDPFFLKRLLLQQNQINHAKTQPWCLEKEGRSPIWPGTTTTCVQTVVRSPVITSNVGPRWWCRNICSYVSTLESWDFLTVSMLKGWMVDFEGWTWTTKYEQAWRSKPNIFMAVLPNLSQNYVVVLQRYLSSMSLWIW